MKKMTASHQPTKSYVKLERKHGSNQSELVSGPPPTSKVEVSEFISRVILTFSSACHEASVHLNISVYQETYPDQHILMLNFIGSLLCSDYSESLFACMCFCCVCGVMFRTGTPFILCDFGLDIHNDK